MTFVRLLVAGWIVLLVGSHATAGDVCTYNPPLTAGSYVPAFALDGDVLTPKVFDETTLRQYPSTKVNVVYGAGAGIVSGSFVGVLLWDLIKEAGVVVDLTRKNDQLRKSIVISASDGYQAVLALGEIIPDFGGEQVIVAYEQDGQPLGPDQGMARLVIPGDKRAGRHVNRITQIAVCGIASDQKNEKEEHSKGKGR